MTALHTLASASLAMEALVFWRAALAAGGGRMRVLGVDPGAKGALALLEGGQLVEVHDMPALAVRRGKTDKNEVDGYALGDLIRALRPDVVVIELVGGMEGQSPSASFNFGRAAGAPEYTAKALGIRVDHMAPATWKNAIGQRGGKDDSRAMAMRLWPGHAAAFRRKMDNDRAEAALIALAWEKKNGIAHQPVSERPLGVGSRSIFD